MIIGQCHDSLVALTLPLVPPPVELHLVHCPHGALHILHPGEAFVETQIVTDGVLKKEMYIDIFISNIMMAYHLTFQVAAFRLKNAKFDWNQL